MRIAVLITVLIMSAFAFVLINNGGQLTHVDAVASQDDVDDDAEACVGDEGDDGYDEDGDKGDNQDEDGGMTQIDPPSLDLNIAVEPTATRNWDGNDDQLEVDDCYYLAPTPDGISEPVEPGSVQSGDANCDGDVSGSDAVALLLQIGGVSAASEDCTGGDADCSGWIDPADVTQVLRLIAGLDTAC